MPQQPAHSGRRATEPLHGMLQAAGLRCLADREWIPTCRVGLAYKCSAIFWDRSQAVCSWSCLLRSSH